MHKPQRKPWILLGLLALALPAASQEPPDSESEGLFFEAVNVTVVNVDVFVTDKSGNPITGLTADDFEIFEDGRPVAISNFYAVEDRQPVAGLSAPATPAPEGETTAPPLPFLSEEEQQLRLIVYVDNFNLRPFNRNRVFRQLRQFLRDQVQENDLVMLVSYDRTFHLRQAFTSDVNLINAKLLEMEKFSGMGVHADSERRDIVRVVEEADTFSDAIWQVRTYADSLFNDLSFTVGALQEFVDSLAGLPGRKALLYVSDGLPMKPAEDIFYMLQQRFDETSVLTEAQDYNLARRFQRLAATANTNRVTFYTIDAAGLRVYSSGTVDKATPGDPGLTNFIDNIQFSNLQSPLQMLAELTGGKAVINTNNVGPALERIATDFGTYYSLGYTPAHNGDGRLHHIKVRVKRKGLRVRHRDSYRDKPVNDRMADGTLASLVYGLRRNPLEIGIDFGPATRRKDGLFQVQVFVRIPLGKLATVPVEDAHYARTRLFFTARDEKGRLSDVQQVDLPITIPDADFERAQRQYYRYEVTLLMRQGLHEVAVGLRDEVAAAASFVRRAITVGQG